MTNIFVTGPPRCGKSTVIKKVVEKLRAEDWSIAGIYCPEIRQEGRRVGFEIIGLGTQNSWILAHTERDEGPQVGKYRVAVENVDEASREEFSRDTELFIVDEVAPMEIFSQIFVEKVRHALNSDTSVLGAVHYSSEHGFIGELKQREDTRILEVTENNRDTLPTEITESLSNS